MEPPLTRGGNLAAVRQDIARAILGSRTEIDAALGSIELRDAQRASAARVLQLLREHGGALLADPVGLGKTYAALAVAKHFSRVIVVAPAGLRAMWCAACAAAGLESAFISHEAMSRGRVVITPAPETATLVVVDEAHRFRNPATRRYARATELCQRAATLLISATPVQNALKDLAAPLALFLGAEALSLAPHELAKYVIRRADSAVDSLLPRLRGPTRVPVALDGSVLRRIHALPPPVPARDEGTASDLLTQLLVRRWTSSQAAFLQSLRRLLARVGGLRDAALAGRRLTRDDLALWDIKEDSVQLAFPALIGTDAAAHDVPAAEIVRTADAYMTAVRALAGDVAAGTDADIARVSALLELRCRHAGERIIAFSQYARTTEAFFRLASRTGGVASLTAAGARIASGRVHRDAILEQFTPASTRRCGDRPDHVDLLIATDMLSEGLNLQEASVVVHLDLPWNPARLDQRVGRVRRMGSRHSTVSVYALDPTGARTALQQVERRLRGKLRLARGTIGVLAAVLPAEDSEPTPEARGGTAELLGAVDQILAEWMQPVASACSDGARRVSNQPTSPPGTVPAAAVRSNVPGWICAYATPRGHALIACLDGRVSDAAEHLRHALAIASGCEADADPFIVEQCISEARRLVAARRAASVVDLRAALTSRARRDLLERVAQSVAAAPRYRRSVVASLATQARAAATMRLSAGAEQVLHGIVAAPLAPEPWLRSVADFVAASGRPATAADAAHLSDGIFAMIVFDCSASEPTRASG
jgi:superfamily II DNA or RNA helicase